MFFRNLTFFRFPQSLDFSELDTQVAELPLKPCGPLEMASRGFINPFGRELEPATHQVDDAIWVSVGGEDKLLPGAVVNDHLARKLDEYEAKEGRRPGGKTRKRLKDDLLLELLPRAFVKPGRLDALICKQAGFIAVDTSSRKGAEQLVSQLRSAMGSFPAMPINSEVSPRNILTAWLAGEPLPDGLAIGEECELRDPIDGGAVVKCQKQEMRTEEIDKHLEAGKQCTRLALVLDDHISFVLGEDLTVRKLKFLDGAVDQLDDNIEDMRAELDARFVLMAGEVRRLFFVLERALKLSKADDSDQPSPERAAPAPRLDRASARVGGAGIETVTIAVDGQHSVTLTPGQLERLGKNFETYSSAVQLARSGVTSIAGMQRALKVGYNTAARVVELLVERGVLSKPDAAGRHTLASAEAF